jgi:predicted CoA-binding protein
MSHERPIRFDDAKPPSPVPILDASGAMEVMRTASRIAIVGASPKRGRASNTVMHYLQRAGFECVPVNPMVEEVLGQRCWPSLEEAVAGTGGPFDIVDVFRRPEYTPQVARSAVGTGCGMLWLQQGIVDWDAARIAHEGGLAVVMDRCTAVEHQHLRAVSG